MAEVIPGNAVVGQSGGPTAVINQSLVGVIEAAAEHEAIQTLYGARNGVRGIIQERFLELTGLDKDLLERVAATPAAALGSTRDKPDEEYCRKILDVFAKRNVRYFFYIGGNDSADAAKIIRDLARASDYDLRVIHIPKTIDNDLRVTDHCPGYGSAAKFVISALVGDDRDNASLPGVKIDVIMGRHAGWLTASGLLARQDAGDGPHLIYVPERRVSPDQFVEDVAEVYGRIGRCLVAVSEGIEDTDGVPWGEKLATTVDRDSHGNVQLSGSGALGDRLAELVKTKVSPKLGGKTLRVRADTFGYLQRSFAGFASPVDQKEARRAGRTAVAYAMRGARDCSVAFRRRPGEKYGISCFRAKLADVARETKPLPPEYVNERGNGIHDSFRAYVAPLVGTLPATGTLG
ncbi:MAG: 6-phosphofructokinase [Phycisphaerae bacterium]|nr:6-phosphofructokinase [Phycisphaerae bacterium]